jgi:hypothetical protein
MLPHQRHEQGSSVASLPEIATELDSAREQVDRILASDTLRGSEVLRRLFRFLADKTFSGQGDQLKEYSVGLDALGKTPTYDPRQDAAVRLQASRLRQKLEEYYRGEGANDSLTIELPRGKFKIVWRQKETAGPPSAHTLLPEPVIHPLESASLAKWRRLAVGFAFISAILVCVSAWSVIRVSRASATVHAVPRLTPELTALWRPFIASDHHLLIAFSDPVFVRFQREGSPDVLYRQAVNEGWDKIVASPEFSAMSRMLGHPQARTSFDYAPRGELIATFVLSQFLAPHRSDVSVTRVGQLSWQQFADNDVIFLAPRETVAEKEASLPVRLAFIAEKSGIRNMRPLPGELQTYTDGEPHTVSSGDTFELVSVIPGPLGRTTVASFTGGGAWGVIGAIRSLMDPDFARVVIQKLKGHSEEMPAAYQVVIRVRYRDGTPINASYVTHRILTLSRLP